jgi:hypothetical protein
LQHGLAELGAQGLLALGADERLDYRLDLDLPVRMLARRFLQPHARQPREPDVEAPVGQTLVVEDLAQPRDRQHRRRARQFMHMALEHRAHHDPAVRVEQIEHHLAVARLEHVQRHARPREEEHVRQGEQRGDCALAVAAVSARDHA